MGVVLDGELAGLLAEAGGRWPEADEDRLAELADSWRAVATSLRDAADNGAAAARVVRDGNRGPATEAFSAYWTDLHGDLGRAADSAEQVVVAVDAMAQGTLGAKKSILAALQATHGQIREARAGVAAAFLGPVIGWLLRLLGGLITRVLGALLRWIGSAIVWLLKQIGRFFRALWNKLFGRKKPTPTPKPTYPRTGKLPHARDLIKNGKEHTGSRLPNQAQPNSVLYKRNPQTGEITNYTVYDDAGNAIKRVDLTGRSHGGIPTPHTVGYTVHRSPDGRVFVREDRMVRPATPEEIP